MNKQRPLLTTPSRYGLLGGGMYIILFLVLAYLKDNPFDAIKYADFLLLPIFIYFSIRDYKIRSNSGELRFWEGMTAGFVCYTILAIIAAVFIYIYFSIDPEYLTQYRAFKITLMEQNKVDVINEMGEESYRLALENIRSIKKLDLSLDSFWRKLATGFIFTSVISIIQRTPSK